jgi:hypothetical protein
MTFSYMMAKGEALREDRETTVSITCASTEIRTGFHPKTVMTLVADLSGEVPEEINGS